MYTVFSSLVILLALMMTANAVPTSAPSPSGSLAPFAPVTSFAPFDSFAPVAENNDMSPQCVATLLALQACLSTTNKDCVDSIDTCMSGIDTADSSVCGSIGTLCHAFSCCAPCADAGRQMVECESHARGCDIKCPVTSEETVASDKPVDSPVQAPSAEKSGASGISSSSAYWMVQIWIMSVAFCLVRNEVFA